MSQVLAVTIRTRLFDAFGHAIDVLFGFLLALIGVC